MNSKIVIPISVIVMIVIVVFSLTQNEIIEKELSSEMNDGSKIQNITDKIKEDKRLISNLVHFLIIVYNAKDA